MATVRRVLGDKPGIAPSTRAAVLTALDVFGLDRPSKFRTARDGLVGLVVPDLQNPIFPALAPKPPSPTWPRSATNAQA